MLGTCGLCPNPIHRKLVIFVGDLPHQKVIFFCWGSHHGGLAPPDDRRVLLKLLALCIEEIELRVVRVEVVRGRRLLDSLLVSLVIAF